MKKHIGSYPCVRVEGGARSAVSQAGVVLLGETVRKSSLSSDCLADVGLLRAELALYDPVASDPTVPG